MDSKVYALSKDLMEGSGENLFYYIAKSLADFVHSRGIANMVLPLGFTFSFPCRQNGLASGDLIAWTKGFKCEGVEGEDVVKLLVKAIRKRDDVKVDVAALLNDTTGCLMSCAWKNPNCRYQTSNIMQHNNMVQEGPWTASSILIKVNGKLTNIFKCTKNLLNCSSGYLLSGSLL